MSSGKREEIEAFVEKVGEFFNQLGQPRICGRLMGWLLICDPAYQSAEELAEATGASKASVSTMVRLLQAASLVESMGVPGERRTFYRIRPGAWSEMMGSQVAKLAGLRRLAEEGLEVMAGEPEERRERLQGMRDLYAFFEAEFPALIERWNERQKE